MKNTKILFLISALSGFFSINASWGKAKPSSDKGTFLHEFAGKCGFARVKCSIPAMFDHDGIDPFIRDGNNQTARDIAIARYELTKHFYCEEVAWELEEYEKRFQEKMTKSQQNNE